MHVPIVFPHAVCSMKQAVREETICVEKEKHDHRAKERRKEF